MTKNEAYQLERLPQKAAAWLLGVTPATLAARPDAPRNRNGTYNAAELVAWLKRLKQRRKAGGMHVRPAMR